MLYEIDESDAEKVIADFHRAHHWHDGKRVEEGSWGIHMSCAECGPKFDRTVTKKNESYELAMAGYKTGRKVWAY